MITAYVSIGNSDDKLTQVQWATYCSEVRSLMGRAVNIYGGQQHGEWASLPYSSFQNACWCIEVEPDVAETVKATLRRIAGTWRQDSIAWAEATTTFLVPPSEGTP